MNIHKHNNTKIKIKTELHFSSIDELYDQLIDLIINISENAYSKNSMTSGVIPRITLIKSLYKRFINDSGNDEKQFTIKSFLNLIEEEINNSLYYESKELNE